MPYTAEDVLARERILRMLLGGPSKSGKTSCSVLTSPKPVYVINTDGKGALDPVAMLGGEFLADDIRPDKPTESFNQSRAYITSHLGQISTVVLDNITGLAGFIEAEVRRELNTKDARQISPEYTRRLMEMINWLLSLPRHVIIIGHLEPGENDVPGSFGSMLGIMGRARTQVSMIVQDWVWLHVGMENNKLVRQFLLAPEGNWNKGVRSIQNLPRMEANVSKFIALMEQGGPPKKAPAPAPAAKPAAAPAARPATTPATRPATTPAARPVNGQPVRR